MDNDNILVEQEFDIPLGAQNYKVKAVAVFVAREVAPQEVGMYHLNFTFRGKQAEMCQLDKTHYSRKQAKRAAEVAFNSGKVKVYARSRIQSWINVGL